MINNKLALIIPVLSRQEQVVHHQKPLYNSKHRGFDFVAKGQ